MKLRSKNYFKTASSMGTWALQDEPSSLARRTLEVVMRVAKPKGKTCLSLGCGFGRFLKGYVRNGAKRVVGADINRRNLQLCKQFTKDLVLCDIENMPFQDKIFDAVECVATMEHIGTPTNLMKEAKRISRMNAHILISWTSYRFERILKTKDLLRFLLIIRDITVPEKVAMFLRDRRVKGFVTYGLFKQIGYSLSEIKKLYASAEMPMSNVGGCSSEGVIVVDSLLENA